MVLDRIAQVVLIFFGFLLLTLLVLGLAVSCRQTAADDPIGATATALAQMGIFAPTAPSTLIGLPPTPMVMGPSPTPTPPASPTPMDPAAATATANALIALTPVATAPVGTGGLVQGSTVTHTITRGEWMIQIARCYGITYSTLQAANRVPNPNFILPGGVLTIPNIGSNGAIIGPPCVVAYTVVAGDTWDSIAARQGTTVGILQRANPGALTVGRSIWVPRRN